MLPENPTGTFIPYASKADPELVQAIPQDYQEQGVKPLDSLPAQYWNWLWNQMTTQFNLSVATTTSILQELQNVLTLAGITPDEAEEDQLATAIKKLTKDVIGDFTDLEFASDDVSTVVEALNALYDTIKNDIDKRVSAIESKIPEAASPTNKLTDEAFVLRHVATNTANFRGEWPTWDEVPEDGDQYPVDYSGNHNPTENDYMVVRDMSSYDDGSINEPAHWVVKDWGIYGPSYGSEVWHDNEGNTFYNNAFVKSQLVNGQWVAKDWGTNKPDSGACIWRDNEGNIFFSYGDSIQWQLVDGQWVAKDWGTNTPTYGNNIWRDDEGNIFYSHMNIAHLQLVNGQWVAKDWGTNKPDSGGRVWHDDEGNTYYSYNSTQLQLVNGQWVAKDWGTNKPGDGSVVWHDDEGNTYYSYNSIQWQLVDGQWVAKDWGTNTPLRGGDGVWRDDEGNIFYSFSSTQLQLIPEHSEAYYKGAWQFKYTGNWEEQGKAGWEPEFSLGSLVDYDELNQHYAKGTSETLDLPNATINAAGALSVKKAMITAPTQEEIAAAIQGKVTVNGRQLRICEIDVENHALILW